MKKETNTLICLNCRAFLLPISIAVSRGMAPRNVSGQTRADYWKVGIGNV
jgi:hypothetical protein